MNLQTRQLSIFTDACHMEAIEAKSVHLVVTSPPYPMIAMWDEIFCQQPSVEKALKSEDGMAAFKAMHQHLDGVWKELWRVLVPGGMVCINIGDATRTMAGQFRLYPNHSRIIAAMLALGFSNLPNILWRKPTNAPNKFMGSGMLAPGAYVTLEHEYVLIFRKGGKRTFTSETAHQNRRRSAFFWEERNQWFSDVWLNLIGTRQNTNDKKLRQRSGAFPFELAYRLINMFSVMGDTVLDPFLGTGTTLGATTAAARNGIGVELDHSLSDLIEQTCCQGVEQGRNCVAQRLEDHQTFVYERQAAGKTIKHTNSVYGFPVMTRQERDLVLAVPSRIEQTAASQWEVEYDMPEATADGQAVAFPKAPARKSSGQLSLFK